MRNTLSDVHFGMKGFRIVSPVLTTHLNQSTDQGTLRSKFPIALMIQFLFDQSKSWSLERRPDTQNFKSFAFTSTIGLRIQTEAFIWTRQKPETKFRTSSNDLYKITYFVSSSSQPTRKKDDINKYLRLTSRCSWRTFGAYKTDTWEDWLIKFRKDSWISSTCTCRPYLKYYTCKHIVSLAVKNNLYEVSPEAKTVPLGTKRKRGKPAKST
jgi:hypothetical protein